MTPDEDGITAAIMKRAVKCSPSRSTPKVTPKIGVRNENTESRDAI